ncbi:DUF5908 family protein [Flavitalea sp.]|nr:DUF5908 family protein [Flavitalea sp.]
MPIEIRELIIKATVVQDDAAGGATPAGAENNSVSPNEEIVNICIQRIMEILKDKNER